MPSILERILGILQLPGGSWLGKGRFTKRDGTFRQDPEFSGVDARRLLLLGMVGGEGDVWTGGPLIGFGFKRRRRLF